MNRKKELITFKLNKAQSDYYKKAHNRNIILKSRRLGFTTFEAIDILDDVLFTPNLDTLLLCYDDNSALEIFDKKVDLAWRNFPEELKRIYQVDTDRASQLKFGFGDNTFSSIIVKSRGRSGTYHRIHISELGKIAKENPIKAEEIKRGTLPSVPLNGRIDIESTAEGEFGLFSEMFWDAWNRGAPRNNSEYKAHFYNWLWDEEEISEIENPISIDEMEQSERFRVYQVKHNLSDIQITYYYLKWIELQKDWDAMRENYPTTPEEAFMSSGKKFFSIETLLTAQKQYAKDGEQKGSWTVFDIPLAGHFYAIGCDPAEGWGNDNSAICIWDFTYRPKVSAIFKNNKIEPDNLAFELKEYGKLYKDALIIVERNAVGVAVLNKLKEIYPIERIYKEMVFDEEEQREKKKLGWHNNLATKPIMMHDFKAAVNNQWVEIPSKELFIEMRTYDAEDLKITRHDKDTVRHWDLLMATAIGFQGRNYIEINVNNSQVITQKVHTYQDLTSPI